MGDSTVEILILRIRCEVVVLFGSPGESVSPGGTRMASPPKIVPITLSEHYVHEGLCVSHGIHVIFSLACSLPLCVSLLASSPLDRAGLTVAIYLSS